ncbi:putative very-long-chain 3-oxoacyl-CoA synthase [Helianthus annuus]|uniref:Very-long-chain 3-oxoacyl-CoA synthase n=1 Tax=Helianthus annuus TaxID=4232 RepID=A0A251S438_HELAN|nr:putative very-long-chain 3-oxoacyl-CoA synthase [Helianthus annuus]KAJ0602208.1 putative very-long-chain 3-oxoacyl-CoA synthase [Helianthus annuus]KAJ0774942.1 putative very-long-chain 3-oxoacyl-CoA synthase [Helianthus annuus]KAJ0937019.1 putative very-long-chain 3-oxoacyl-CoA synthase [Helianthus annuus]KAJ0944949.1 putative very-long-chain 3-oxoacyl-CoA synthase [Helianthus annuus]
MIVFLIEASHMNLATSVGYGFIYNTISFLYFGSIVYIMTRPRHVFLVDYVCSAIAVGQPESATKLRTCN